MIKNKTKPEYAEERVPIIPRKILFGNPDRVSVRFSPNGAKISYLSPVKGVLNVFVGSTDRIHEAKPVTKDIHRGIRSYFWSYSNDHIIYLQDVGGNENWRVYSVNLDTGKIKDLTPYENAQARIQGVSLLYPYEILVGLNDRVPQLHDIYRVNIESGEKKLIEKNMGFSGFYTDYNYNVRLAEKMTRNGGREIFYKSLNQNWDLFMEIEMEDSLTTGPVTFDKSGNTLYMVDSRDRDTAVLISQNMETGEQELLAKDPRADVSGFIIHPSDRKIEAVAFTYERVKWIILNESISEDLKYLQNVAKGDVEVVSRTLDDRFWIVGYLMDNGPLRYYLYDKTSRKARFLFTNRKDLEDLTLARMSPTIIKSRDGLKLVSYYTLPVLKREKSVPIPKQGLPTVLLVHGGPWSRDEWGFSSLHQWLANRGYCVLSVNFRGSTGFGKAFVNAGNKEWGSKMHDDLIDAVNWAVKTGIANPSKIAIMGGSYGGYATLAGLSMTPQVFVCGVDIVGPSNLVTLLETFPPYWEPEIELFTVRVGDHRTPEGREFLLSRSPLTYSSKIMKPLLIGQGSNDPRVKKSESDQIVKSLKEKSIPVTYVLFSDEGHGFARPENRLAFYAVAESFLALHMGGRCEPFGKSFKGSSISVPAGAEDIPGLMESLNKDL